MLRKSRKGRMTSQYRTLTVEALEDRTLLDGVVTAVLSSSRLLQITADGGDNQFTITNSPVAGQIRIAPNFGSVTQVN